MKERIKNYIRAGYSAINIVSHEETRVHREIVAAAKEASTEGFSTWTWTITRGIVGADKTVLPNTEDIIAAFDAFSSLPEKSVLVMLDAHLFFQDSNPLVIRKMKETITIGKGTNRVLVIVGCRMFLPPELEKLVTVMDFKLPTREELNVVLDGIATSCGYNVNGTRDALLDAASGLTTTEAEDAFALAWIESGNTSVDPKIVAREKAATVRKNGIVEIVDTPVNADSIGGLDAMKGWLKKRKGSFSKKAKEFGLPTVKGCMAVGIPGTGKSLSAKATAAIFGIPLIKLDAGRIFGSLVGQSEANLRSAIATAEAIAPCVLWLDEIEKGLSGSKSSGQTDGGTSARVFGSFLQWMNDKTAPVFVFATANDVTQLPPEFLRKGRFDELWFVDIPTESERKEIFEIHAFNHRRSFLTEDGGADKLAKQSIGFTGSEIEAAFSEALYAAFDADREVTVDDVQDALTEIIPLSKTMSSEIKALSEWSKGRARPATSTIAESCINNIRKIMQS